MCEVNVQALIIQKFKDGQKWSQAIWSTFVRQK
jgi:hypothetical protein